MKNLTNSFSLALFNLFQPKIFLILTLPFFLSLITWGFVSWIFFDNLLVIFSNLTAYLPWAEKLNSWLSSLSFLQHIDLSRVLVYFLIFSLLLPLTFITALVMTSVLAMPYIVSFVGQKYYPTLIKKSDSKFFQPLLKVLKYSLIYLFLWVATLPFWFLPFLGFLIPILLNAYLNSKVFVFDSLSDYATSKELDFLIKKQQTQLFTMGLVLSFLLLIPFFFIVFPIYAGLCYTHYNLKCLSDLRQI